MPLDLQTEKFLAELNEPEFSITRSLPVELSRQNNIAAVLQSTRYLEPLAKIEDTEIPGPNGSIPVRIYTPEGTKPFPVFVWLHGGGWVWGNLDSSEEACRRIANLSDCIVISVDYRLAPEHKFPIPLEDAYAAVKWAAEQADSFSGDASRITIGGDSAGGNLATAVCMLARDRKGPRIQFQVLVYPVTDSTMVSQSYQDFANGYFLSKEKMAWFWEQYLNSEEDKKNPYAAPIFSENLGGLPSALIITAEYDPLRDEGESYAKRLQAAGVAAKCIRSEGTIHGFFTRVATFDKAKAAVETVAKELRNIFF